MRPLIDWVFDLLEITLFVVSAAIIAAAILSGCSTVSESLKDSAYYRRDIEFEVNGRKAMGALVVPRASSYVVRGAVRGGFDFLIVRSCHREFTAEREGDSFKYVFEPRAGIEDNRACPLEIRGAERDKGRHSFGFIDFESERDQLPAELYCNGAVGVYPGTSVCQAPHGLIQKLVLPGPGRVSAGKDAAPECSLGAAKEGRVFEFRMPPRQCQFLFEENAAPHRTHRMTTLGYEQTVVRRL